MNGTISSLERVQAVRFSVLVIQPPALASLDVEVEGQVTAALPLDSHQSQPLGSDSLSLRQPAFALDYGFSSSERKMWA